MRNRNRFKRSIHVLDRPSRPALLALSLLAFMAVAHPYLAAAQENAAPAAGQTSASPASTAPAAQVAPPASAFAPDTAKSPAASTATSPGAPAAAAPALQPPAIATGEPALKINSIGSFGAEVLDHALNADIIVQIVMLGLILAALVTWTVWLKKVLELRSARREVRESIHVLDAARTFVQAHEAMRAQTGPVAQFVQAAVQEIRFSDGARSDGVKERIALRLERLEVAASRKIMRGTAVLATIGSTAPFVGLFGTVWGIMNSFIGIENAHTTNLAVVAPGIAQALLATALGLVAAIPAVMTYNALARSTTNYRTLLGDASALVMRLVSRDLERARMPLAEAAE